jgi:hypothetical protein
VADFLRTEGAEWLWWVDTDMGFAADTIDRLLEAADPVERPVVGALCFAQREAEDDGVGGYRPIAWPTVMDWTFVENQGGFQVRWDYPRNTLTRVHGTGSACILIHRSVFERVRAAYVEESGNPNWGSWYTRVTNPTTGELVGEDLSFCARLMRLEIPVHVHTGVQTTHRKNIWLQEEDYWRQRALNGPVETVTPLPKDQRLAYRYAVVPTHNRPEQLKALVTSLAPQVDEILVLDNASDPPVDHEALSVAGKPAMVQVFRDVEQPPHLSRFWNSLFDTCQSISAADGLETWDVAVFNDDAVIPAGWYDAVSTALRGHDKAVVGHTGTVAVHRGELVDAYPYPRHKRMCPWAFVVKGEAGLRADESMRWFYFDDDFNRRAIDLGGALAVPGPLVVNANAVESTAASPVLTAQAEKDRLTFIEKWGGMP